jgi:hypothetical protein
LVYRHAASCATRPEALRHHALVLDGPAAASSWALLRHGVVVSPDCLVIPNPSSVVCVALRETFPTATIHACTSHVLLGERQLSAPPFDFVYLDYCGNVTSRSGQHRLRDIELLFERGMLAADGCCLLAVSLAARGTAAVSVRPHQSASDVVDFVLSTAVKHRYLARCAGVLHYRISQGMYTASFVVSKPSDEIGAPPWWLSNAWDELMLKSITHWEQRPGDTGALADQHFRNFRLTFFPLWPPISQPPHSADLSAAPLAASIAASPAASTAAIPAASPVAVPATATTMLPLGIARQHVAECFAQCVAALCRTPESAATGLVLVADSKFLPVTAALLRHHTIPSPIVVHVCQPNETAMTVIAHTVSAHVIQPLSISFSTWCWQRSESSTIEYSSFLCNCSSTCIPNDVQSYSPCFPCVLSCLPLMPLRLNAHHCHAPTATVRSIRTRPAVFVAHGWIMAI